MSNADVVTCLCCGRSLELAAGVTAAFCPFCGARMGGTCDREVPAEDGATRAGRPRGTAGAGAQETADAEQAAGSAAAAASAPVPAPQGASPSVEEAQAMAARAVEQAARAAQQAQLIAQMAAQATTPEEAMEAARRATQQAADALAASQAAEASHRTQQQRFEERRDELERGRQELERQQQELERQAAEAARQAEERRKAAEAEAARQAEEQRQRQAAEAARQAERVRAEQARQAAEAEAARQEAAERARRRENPRYQRDVAIRASNGIGLFVVTVPEGWSLAQSYLQRQGTASRPYIPYAKLTNGEGGMMTLTLGDAGTRNSKAMEALMVQYGAAAMAVDRINYAPIPDPRDIANSQMLELAKVAEATDLYRVRGLPSERLQQRQQESQAHFQQVAQASGGAALRDPFAAEVLNVYEFKMDGLSFNAAIYVREFAIKDGSGVEYLNPVGLAFGLGSAIGGAFSRKRKARERAAQQAVSGQTSPDSSTWCLPDFDAYVSEGTIYWSVSGIATLIAPAADFERQLEQAFLPLTTSFRTHADVNGLSLDDVRQSSMAVQQATNREINAMNMRTEATLAAARQMQAAADARFESWQRQSDARHAAFRERTNAQFSSGGSGGAGDFSEAIRGVNTYVTSDGREVEVDVRYDRAFENQAGDVIGWSKGENPSSDWTEIPRA